ncbi:hypothetical protein DYB35_002921 [Aphanomyces astaci]|uniref:Uncharacterized protein n=1 Tax=Aphanomyces astaci TaxID=112090 RepID=A0A397BFT1_APHAT|nr:hypothetical protein DYB36_009962 [Aphanomyces astaci]RHY86987.1 hypothetical protein DYB35_002921 [Aphanomyces astaci]
MDEQECTRAAVLLSVSFLLIFTSYNGIEVSVVYATIKHEPAVSSMGKFNGLFFAIYKSSRVTGNLISSVVLDYLAWRMLALAPVFILNGLQQGYATSEFTSNFIRPSLGSSSIGYVMAVFGVVNVVGSYTFGKVADRLDYPGQRSRSTTYVSFHTRVVVLIGSTVVATIAYFVYTVRFRRVARAGALHDVLES